MMKKIILFCGVFSLVLVLGGCTNSPVASTGAPALNLTNQPEPVNQADAVVSNQTAEINANDQPIINSDNLVAKNMSHFVTIKTSQGDISFVTYDADAPKTVENFITLANKGYYNGIIFHRVIPGFMIQTGDPLGLGTGGPGYKFDDELNSETDSYKAGYKKGVVAMANAGPNTNGSQFFIMVADYPLPNNYTIFGKVVAGQDVADVISKVTTGPNDRPVAEIKMEKVTVSDYSAK